MVQRPRDNLRRQLAYHFLPVTSQASTLDESSYDEVVPLVVELRGRRFQDLMGIMPARV